MFKKKGFLLVAIICFTSTLSYSQTTEFSYQGSLKDGASVANGSYDFQFALFDGLSGGAQLGSTITQTSVPVANGIFSVKLDFGNQFPGSGRFLEIRVKLSGGGGFTTLSPRQVVNSSPYSVTAANFTGALAGDVTGAQNSTVIANNAVTAAKIAAGQVVKSVNGLTDNVTLAAGSNITLTPAGNTVTIASTGGGGVSGSGTVNSVPVWSGGTTLGNSLITQSGGVVQLPASVQLAPGTNGHSIAFGSPNSEVGLTMSGATGRADIRYGNGILHLLSGAAGSVPPSNSGISIYNDGSVEIGSPGGGFAASLHVNAVGRAGVYVTSDAAGVIAQGLGNGDGVRGSSANGDGVVGATIGGTGVAGSSNSGSGVTGTSTGASTFGVYGTAPGAGVVGITTGGTGVAGQSTSGSGVTGQSTNGYGVYGISTNSFAGYFQGKVRVTSIPAGATSGSVCYNGSGDLLACSSSLRFKKNVQPFSGGMALLKKLKPITYDWKDDSGHDVGLGAEDVAKIDPLFAVIDTNGEINSVKYDRLAVVFINAIKEQQGQIETLQKSNAEVAFRNSKNEIEGVKYEQLATALVNAIKEQQQMIEKLRRSNSALMVRLLKVEKKFKARHRVGH